MKKLFIILSVSMFLFSCTNKKTWEFTKQENEKKNSYANIYLHMNSGYEIVELENNKTSS